MSQASTYQHFREDEKYLVDRAYDIQRQVEESYTYYLTEFLDPRQLQILQTVLAQTSLQLFSSRDYLATEYGKLLIAPDYYQFDIADFDIALLEIQYNSKFNQLTHPQILGSLLHKLGVERSTFGDILIHQHQAQLFVERRLVDYFQASLVKIAKASVSLKEIPFDRQISAEQEMVEKTILCSSMRLDKVVATSFNLSRRLATQLVESEKVKVNYVMATKSTSEVRLGDLISVRGFGRFIVKSKDGLSKNGKHKVTITRLVHR